MRVYEQFAVVPVCNAFLMLLIVASIYAILGDVHALTPLCCTAVSCVCVCLSVCLSVCCVFVFVCVCVCVSLSFLAPPTSLALSPPYLFPALSLLPPLISAGTSFFRERAPDFFRDFLTSLFTMFQVLSGDSWASGVSRTMFL